MLGPVMANDRVTDRPATSVRVNKKQASQVLTYGLGAARAMLIAPIVALAGVSGWSVLIAGRRQGCENGFPDQLCHFRAVGPDRKRRASGPWSPPTVY
jgi:hypothetical protein